MRSRTTASAAAIGLLATLVAAPVASAVEPDGTEPLPITEGFDDCALAGWEIISVDSDAANTWECSEQYSNIDVNAYGNAAPADEWLIMPPVDLTTQDDEELSFRSYTAYNDVAYPQVEVLVSTDYPRSGDPSDGSWTALVGAEFSPAGSREWTASGPVDLSGIDAESVSIAFRYTSSGTGGGTAATWRLDAIDLSVPEPECSEADVPISTVQGDGFSSPFDGDVVTIEGVVTFADDDLDAFFVQEEPADEDGDPTTSEALYVFDRRELPAVGSTVQLTDRVSERFGSTQMSFPAIEVCDVPATEITPTDLTLPLGTAQRESLEHMLVMTTQDLDVTGLFGQFGEIGLTLDEAPLPVPTSVLAPDTDDAQDLFDTQADNYLKLDDRNEGAFSRFPWGSANDGIGPRPGDVIGAGVVGPLDYTFDEYKIQPLEFPEIVEQDEHPRPEGPATRGGTDIGAFNVLNYFNTFGDEDGLRGATNADDFEVQTTKVVAAIEGLDAAVLGLVEIENDYGALHDDDDTTEASIVTLVDALNTAAGFAKWDFVAPGEDLLVEKEPGLTDEPGEADVTPLGVGTDAIAVGIIYQPDRATPTGEVATFDIDALLEGDTENNRWPLAQTFEIDGRVSDVTVVVNHFKSKGSSCTDTAGPDFALEEDVETDLLGNCDLTRQYAANRVLEWLDTDPTGVEHDRYLVTGDLNAYQQERPVQIFEEAGYTDLIEEFGDDAFTYKFDGRYGRLDHALASPTLVEDVRDAGVWQINSLEYYNNLYDVAPVDETAYASSDHDPVSVSLVPPAPVFRDGARPGRDSAPGYPGNRRR